MILKVKKLDENAVIPFGAKPNDAGLDLVATSIISNTPTQVTYGLGIAVEIPPGFVGLIFPRSSIRNTNLQLSNSVGVIDSGYRGELQATFNKIRESTEEVNGFGMYMPGDRVCQLVVMPIPFMSCKEVKELSKTERGEGGFGSTGK